MLLEIWYDGKHFWIEDDDAARPDNKPSGVEKAAVNEIISADHEWTDVLDAFAAYGIGSYIFSKHAKHVLALELNGRRFAILWPNVCDIANIEVQHIDNVEFLKRALRERMTPPELIDLDTYDNTRAQLPLALEWVKYGALLLTTGEIHGIYRNSPFGRAYHPEIEGQYIGKEAVRWAEEVFIPDLIRAYSQYELRPIHFYAEPTSIRVVFEVGGFKFTDETKAKLAARPHYVGWFNNAAKFIKRRKK